MSLARPMAAVLLAAALSTAAAGEPGPAPAAAGQPSSIWGFSPEHAARQAALEARFDASIDPAEMRGWMEQMASAPNHVGSPHDKANAEFMLDLFKSWGFDARIETFMALYPTPIAESLELLGAHPFKAALHEPAIPQDRTSSVPGALPPYLAYQGDGDVTAPLIYVNYGMPDDYAELERLGLSVKGKIVIARYGAGWRGLKPKLAQEHGAVGCLIYSDPADDGYATDDPYPTGPQRPREGVQRGSVMDQSHFPGDPLTPGVGATAEAKRLTRETSPAILKIPALPISWGDAEPLLRALGGPVAPRSWRGALPFTYHVGPSGAEARLVVRSDWSLKPVYDVIAVLPGRERPDEWVIRGNHHDGWVMGASDPLSGNVALMEEAKAVGGLAKAGWRPKRTLIYASWDAEEPGLIGSTEWAEQHDRELQQKGVLYLNTDGNQRGFLGAGGSQALQHAVWEAARDVKDPETGATVLERLRGRIAANAYTANEARLRGAAAAVAKGEEIPLPSLGSGSDYSGFLQHLGVASLDLGFGGERETNGNYHSLYDSFDHYVRFGDPTFQYEAALAKVAGRIMLRAAEADLPPFRFTPTAAAMAEYAADLKRLADTQRERDESLARLTRSGAFRLAADPERPLGPPPAGGAPTPKLDFAPLDQAVSRLKTAAAAYDRAAASATRIDTARLDPLLNGMEQQFLAPEGLPDRAWFRNLAYAPGRLTGYGVKTLPGVREAIEDRRFDDAVRYIARTAAALDAYAARLDQARAVLQRR